MPKGRAITVSTEGLDALQAKLSALPSGMITGAENAVEATTDAVADIMRDGAPVREGALRDGIVSESSGLHGEAKSTADHSVYVEFGTSSAPEQPFAVPAAEQAPKLLTDNMRTYIKEQLP